MHNRCSLKRVGEVANPLGMALPSQAPGRLHTARSDNNSICAYVHLYAQSLVSDLQYINRDKSTTSPRLKSESIHSISVSNSILLPTVALPGSPILFRFLPLIILTARTLGVSRRYTIERHLAKTSKKQIKSISLYSLL